MKRIVVSVLALLLVFAACGSKTMDNTTPEGAFNIFVDDMVVKKDLGLVYDKLPEHSRALWEQVYEIDGEVIEVIEANYPPGEKEAAFENLGADVWRASTDAREYFMNWYGHVVDDFGMNEEIGAEIANVEPVSEDRVVVWTEADEDFAMVKSPDGVWRVDWFTELFTDELENSRNNLDVAHSSG
jgi:hypothetical protein